MSSTNDYTPLPLVEKSDPTRGHSLAISLHNVADHLDTVADGLYEVFTAFRSLGVTESQNVIRAREHLEREARDLRKRAEFYIQHPESVPVQNP